MSVHTKRDGRVFVVYRDHGRIIWEPFGRGGQALVSAKARDLEVKLRRLQGGDAQAGADATLSFGELAQMYINARRSELAPKTISEVLRLLARAELSGLVFRRACDLSMMDWLAVQDRLIAHGAGNRTVNIYFRYLSPIFTWAVAHRMIAGHPWRERVPLKAQKRHIDLLSLAEFGRLIAAAPDHLAWALQVAYYTGMRPGPSELFAARWDHVDWTGRRIRIYASKTQTWRWQYLPPAFVWQLLRRFAGSRWHGEASPYICAYGDRRVTSLKVSLAASLAKAGITKHVRLYDIRHLHITHALAGGAPIGDLAERVGHADTTMIVRVYAHMVDEIRTKHPFSIPTIPAETVP